VRAPSRRHRLRRRDRLRPQAGPALACSRGTTSRRLNRYEKRWTGSGEDESCDPPCPDVCSPQMERAKRTRPAGPSLHPLTIEPTEIRAAAHAAGAPRMRTQTQSGGVTLMDPRLDRCAKRPPAQGPRCLEPCGVRPPIARSASRTPRVTREKLDGGVAAQAERGAAVGEVLVRRSRPARGTGAQGVAAQSAALPTDAGRRPKSVSHGAGVPRVTINFAKQERMQAREGCDGRPTCGGRRRRPVLHRHGAMDCLRSARPPQFRTTVLPSPPSRVWLT